MTSSIFGMAACLRSVPFAGAISFLEFFTGQMLSDCCVVLKAHWLLSKVNFTVFFFSHSYGIRSLQGHVGLHYKTRTNLLQTDSTPSVHRAGNNP